MRVKTPTHPSDRYSGFLSSLDIAHFSLQISERDVTVSVLQSFYTVLLNKHLLEILRENEKIQQNAKFLGKNERREESGMGIVRMVSLSHK